MKFFIFCRNMDSSIGHPPRGGCGLKYILQAFLLRVCKSPSTRRVWIEIGTRQKTVIVNAVTLHAEGVD